MAKDQKKGRKTDKETIDLVASFKGINDVFFEALVEDPGMCEELLQVLLDNPRLHIKPETLKPQYDVKFIANRSVRVDAYVEGSEDVVFNIEVQRSDQCAHLRRVRYNGSAITVKRSEPGDDFKDVQELYIVYITENDFLKGGKTVYHAVTHTEETGQILDDGLHVIYVNAEVDDGSKAARLMRLFKESGMELDVAEFPKFSKRFTQLKNDPKEVSKLCREVQTYAEKYAEKYVKEAAINECIRMGIKHGFSDKKITADLMADHHLTEVEAEEVLRKYRENDGKLKKP